MTDQTCTRCVMDTSAPDISFDAEGKCNFCREFMTLRAEKLPPPAERERRLAGLVDDLRRAGRGRDYDCILGVSGGLDSSFAIYEAKRLGLRPLAVHFDNGWNSELSNRNIEVLVRKLKVDLHTHVVDWEEFRDLQRAFFAAGVLDIELITDNAIFAVLFAAARRFRTRYILTGSNFENEGMRIPRGWNHCKLDCRNLWAIHRRFGTRFPIRTLPTVGLSGHLFYEKVMRIRGIGFLQYLAYDRDTAIKTLRAAVDWRAYEKKHYESVFTRFYQGYILPRKFGVDKRRYHFANLVCAGQMDRGEALRQLAEESPYGDPQLEAADRAYVIKKLGMSEDEFAAYMRKPPVPHTAYPSIMPIIKVINRVSLMVKGRPTF